MTSFTKDQVVQIVTILNESNFNKVHLEFDGFQITASKVNANMPEIKNHPKDANRIKKTIVETPASAARLEEIEDVTEDIVSEHVPDIEEENLVKVKAPMLGTFYSAPDPESPPFVKVDDLVSKHDSVCIIEVMKLFNTIRAGVDGYIRKICVEDGQMVEYDQTLFLIEPSSQEP